MDFYSVARETSTKTSGHLLVIRGFDSRGEVLVNDPAAPDAGRGMLTYKREDLEVVWMRRGGTSYILTSHMDPSATTGSSR